ncbi:MAG: hypothetical protein OXR84_10980 [Magnetovibrio sp.]|nr:hypothetical protein [Magnetovibrio sp.]
MSVFRNSRRAGLAVLALVLALAAAVATPEPAAGQETAPVKLTAPKKLKPAAPAEEQEPRRRATAPRFEYKSGPQRSSVTALPSIGGASIQVDQLQSVDPDAAGILSAEQGGFGIGMWAGSERRFVERLIDALPAAIPSTTMRDVAKRLLLSVAVPPDGAPSGPSLAARRMRALIAMGEYAAALDLLSAMPRQGRGPGLVRAEAALRLVTKDQASACRLAAEEVSRQSAAFWQKALFFCQVLAGETDKAELGLSLLRETGLEDPLFLELASSMMAAQPATLAALPGLGPLHLAMIGKTGSAMPMTDAVRHPGALRLLAVSPTAPAVIRLHAAETAAAQGVLGAGVVARFYKPGGPAADQPAAAEAGAEPPRLPMVERAALYQAAAATKVPAAKAEAISLAVKSAVAGGRLQGVARIFAPLVADLPPSSDLLWFAPTAFRVLLVSGDEAGATGWLKLIRTSAAIAEESQQLLNDVAPLAELMGQGGTAAETPLPAERRGVAVLFHGLLGALGREVPADRLNPLVLNSAPGPAMPDMALWMRLVAANAGEPAAPEAEPSAAAPPPAAATVVAGPVVTAEALPPPTPGTQSGETRIGERLLLMLLALGDGPLAEANPLVVSEVVRGLHRVGLAKEARGLAMEAAITAGL